MPLQPPFTVTTEMQNLGQVSGLASGKYIAQNRGDRRVFYGSAVNEPADSGGMYICPTYSWFRFDIGAAELPVWVIAAFDDSVLAISNAD